MTPQPISATTVRSRVQRLGPVRVVASDLDGTLLRDDGTVSDRTRAAWAAAEASGLETVLVTARPPRWLDDLTEMVGAHGTALCGNGAFVYDVPSRTITEQHGLAPGEVLELVSDLRRTLPGISFACETVSGYGHELAYTSGHPVPVDAVVGSVETMLEARDGEPTGKLLARHTGMGDARFRAEVARVVGARGIVAYSGADGLAEISAPGVTKAAALARWCAAREVEPAAVWAFGDMPNDTAMLTWAGTGVAVANAHPDLLAVADLVTTSNEHDGVAHALEVLNDGEKGLSPDH